MTKEQAMTAIKTFLVALVAGVVGFGAAVFWMKHQAVPAPVPLPAGETTVSEPANAVPENPPVQRTVPKMPRLTRAEEQLPASGQRRPEDILTELASIQIVSGPAQGRAQYRVLSLLDQLAQAGPAALPAVRQFLASNRDVAYSPAANGNNARNGMLPPSLRFGLFDVVQQIGGAEGEQLLVESLSGTARGTELSYLAQLLETSAPGKYRDTALAAAKTLLASGRITDQAERDSLFNVLRDLKDNSYVATAQAQLVSSDGRLDRSALKYLQQTLGDQSLSLAQKLSQDSRIADADSREAIGRLALNYVGKDDAAVDLFHKAALDPQLKPDQRRNLIEDLNQDGISNRKNPTPEDLKIVANRYALTQAYLEQPYVKNDQVLSAAFAEANKDLAKILQKAGVPPGQPK